MLDAISLIERISMERSKLDSSDRLAKLQRRIASIVGSDLSDYDDSLLDSTCSKDALTGISKIFSKDFVTKCLRYEIERLNSHYEESCPGGGINGYYRAILYAGKNFTVTVSYISLHDHKITMEKNPGLNEKAVVESNDSIYKVISGSAHLNLWQKMPPTQDNPFPTLYRTPKRFVLTENDHLYIEGDSVGVTVAEIASPVVMILIANHTPRVATISNYDISTGKIQTISAADPKASRIQFLTTFLREMDASNALEVMTPLLKHPAYFVRWHVMREMLAFDLVGSMKHLDEMIATDCDSRVVKSASSTKLIIDRELSNAN